MMDQRETTTELRPPTSDSGGALRFPEFDRAEFEQRWERARSLMAEVGLDALFIANEQNFRYLSGLVTHFWVSKSRPLFFILPTRRDPVLVVTPNQVSTAEATSWVQDVRSWEGFAAEGIDLVATTLRELGLAGGQIGAELGHEQRINLPFAEFVRLQGLLPEARFVDAADLLWKLRLTKSPAEIEYLRRSNEITSTAYSETFATLREGMTEREIYAAWVMSAFRQGAERPGYLPMTSGEGNYHRRAALPNDRALRRGDLFWMDGGCIYRGYWTDVARMAAIGSATDRQKQHYTIVRSAMHKAIQATRPGVTMAELVGVARKEMEDHDVKLTALSRIGHGIGLDITEPPSIVASDPTVVRPGMALTMEPTSMTEFGFFQLEENYVVTEDGPVILTESAPEELPVV
jgi:Xaa-Pro dipeptidase